MKLFVGLQRLKSSPVNASVRAKMPDKLMETVFKIISGEKCEPKLEAQFPKVVCQNFQCDIRGEFSAKVKWVCKKKFQVMTNNLNYILE